MKHKELKHRQYMDSLAMQSIIDKLSTSAQVLSNIKEVNLNKGMGIIDEHNRCFWDNKGHRIQLQFSQPKGISVERSTVKDPIYDELDDIND